MKKLQYSSICLALFIAGCGGSGGGANNPPNLSGTAAVGAAIKEADVTAKCQGDSDFSVIATTNDDGFWSGNVDSDSFPCVVKVFSETLGVDLHSFATNDGTLNITPLTDLALIIQQKKASFDWVKNSDDWPEDLNETTNDLLAALKSKNYAIPDGDPFTTPFAIGDNWDIVLDDLGANDTFDNYAALADLMANEDYDKLPSNPNLRALGDGAALEGKLGATGTFKGETYTFTESTVWIEYLPLTHSGTFMALPTTDNSFWKIDQLIRTKDMIGKPQNCSTDPASVSISLELPTKPIYSTNFGEPSCTVILTEVSETDSSFKAKFAAKLRNVSGDEGTVLDGFVIHKEVSEPEPTPSDVPATFTAGSATETYDRVSCVPQDTPTPMMVVTLSDTVLGETQIVLSFMGSKSPESGTQYTSTSSHPTNSIGNTDFRLHIRGYLAKYNPRGEFFTGESSEKVASYISNDGVRKFTGANIPTGNATISFDITCPEET